MYSSVIGLLGWKGTDFLYYIITMCGKVTFVSREIGSPNIMDIIATVVSFACGFEMLSSVISLD